MSDFAPVFGHEKFYEVNKEGEVFRLERIDTVNGFPRRVARMKIKQYRQCREYYYVVLARPTKTIFVHRVVAQSFLGVHKGMIVNHKDGNKLNNKLENLEWVTYRENTLHAKMTGLINNSGERHYKAMLTNNDVLEIRGLLRSGLPQRKIAKKYNVTQTTISCINRNKTWKHI